MGSEAGRALHLRVEPQAHRPLPETRLLAGQSHGDCRQADRRELQRPLHTRLGGDSNGHASLLDEIRELTDSVFRGLDLEREIVALETQRIGDTLVLPGDDELDGVAVCHCGAGSEAGSNTCYVKVAAVRPGAGAADRFERLLDACEGFAADSAVEGLVAGVNTGRLDAYRRLLSRGFRIEQIGVAMHLRPGEPALDTPEHYVIDDLR